MLKRLAVIILLISLLPALSGAEVLELFKASEYGSDAWVWGEARIKSKLGKLIVSERNKRGNTGGVFTGDKFAYFDNGVIQLNVDQVLSGDYTVQVLGFNGDRHVGTLDIATSATESGEFTYGLKGKDIGKDVDRLVFKIWVGSTEGASTKFSELSYVVPLHEEEIVLNEKFIDPTAWQQENVLLNATDEGAAVVLKPGESFGAILSDGQYPREGVDALLMQTKDVENGDLTVQLIVFDPDGVYLTSINALNKVKNGSHAVRLDRLEWPEDADRFALKIWLGGQASAKANITRLMLLKP